MNTVNCAKKAKVRGSRSFKSWRRLSTMLSRNGRDVDGRQGSEIQQGGIEGDIEDRVTWNKRLNAFWK
ncbi:hypothetical protein GOP47_0019010 [Adiantum capillus-veneris]|uniref:Uncharacterized protein n=1 Tax=Adiantum capillus-veneris TaxID=13818 RepID=A0A9D4ZB83_ADICA|nr:hypothetical protein GOP47_0019010 [Adiantum capillus-veneris]